MNLSVKQPHRHSDQTCGSQEGRDWGVGGGGVGLEFAFVDADYYI